MRANLPNFRLPRPCLAVLLLLPLIKMGDLRHEPARVNKKEITSAQEKPLLPNAAPVASAVTGIKTSKNPPPTPASPWQSLLQHLQVGKPIEITLGNTLPRKAWLRPSLVLADNFQATLGTDKSNRLGIDHPRTFTGFVGHPAAGTQIAMAVSGESLAAIISEPDGTLHEISQSQTGGSLQSKTTPANATPYTCRLNPQRRLAAATLPAPPKDHPEPILQAATLTPLNEQGGQNPASNEYDQTLDSKPGGHQYENSLLDSYLLVVLDKSATGDDSTANLTTKTAQYIARIALLSAIFEHQIGARVRFQELILTPNTGAYTDIPFSTVDNNRSIEDFADWGDAHRPLSNSPRTYATKIGAGLSGSTIGLAYINTANTSLAYSLVRTNFDATLLIHELGHILGSIHTSGGVMNASYQAGQQNFFTFTLSGQTAAQQIYNGSKVDFDGNAPLRHPGEIPFAINDFTRADPDSPITITPLVNDLAIVPGGEFNTSLQLLETGPVFPHGSATLTQDGDSLTLTPAPGYTGLTWFSYTLQGNLGNEGNGWLHKGDIAVLFGDPPAWDSLTLLPGDTYLHIPPSIGDITLQNLPSQAHATISLDNSRAILLHVDNDATGSDTLTYTQNSQTYTLDLTYAGAASTQPDIFIHNTTDPLRFNPLHNDTFSGSSLPQVIQPTPGPTGSGTPLDLLPNGHMLSSATLPDSSKGSITLETHMHLIDGSSQQKNTGFINFTPRQDATGIAEIQYTLLDAAGNLTNEKALLYLKLHTIHSPSETKPYIRENNGLKLEYEVHAVEVSGITGNFTTTWDVSDKPLHASVTFSSTDQPNATATFSHPGTYELRLTTQDSLGNQFVTTREIHVLPNGQDPPEGSSMGPDIQLPTGLIRVPQDILDTGILSASVTDDDGPALIPTYNWTLQEGSDTPTITNPQAVQTNIQFPTGGTYTLRLSADDGAIHTFREILAEYQPTSTGHPASIGLGTIYLPTNSPLHSIPLYPLFYDSQDADSALQFSLLPSNTSLIFQTAHISGDPPNLEIQPIPGANGSSTLSVQATDTDGNTATTDIHVTISNHPATIEDTSLSISENPANSSTITPLTTTNPDGDTLIYSIISSTPSPGAFSINPDTGQITVADNSTLDFETHPQHILQISVTDSHLLHTPRTATLTINLEDVNEAPALPDFNFTITNLHPSPYPFALLSPQDPEGQDTTTHILSGNDDNAFSIDQASTLTLDDPSSFSISTLPRRFLTLRTTDNGVPPASSDTTVRIDYHECLNPPGTNDPHYYAPTDPGVDATWQTPAYDHTSWPTGPFPIGFDSSRVYTQHIETNVQSVMAKKSSSLYLRIPFSITLTSQIGTFYLQTDFDDGLIASINGNRILSLNAPEVTAYNAVALADQSANPPTYSSHDLLDSHSLLTNGNNVLCIQLLNSDQNDPDAYLDARLFASSIGTSLAAAAPEIRSDGIGGFGLPGRTNAILKGTVLNTGGQQPTVGLVLDPIDKGNAPENWTHHFILPSFTGVEFSYNATGLLPGTTYHYGFYGTNSGGTSWSTINTFSTRTNRLPIPSADTYNATAGIPLHTTSANSVLSNDSDPDSHPISATLVTPPQNGTFLFNSNGTFTYTPDPTFSGTDTFTYLLSDTFGSTSTSHTWVSKKDTWKYQDTGAALDYTWRQSAYDDSSWPNGGAEMGYGDGDETTTLSYGGNASAKYPTYYFRKTFSLPDDAVALTTRLILKRDDAAALYLNGEEFHRDDNLANLANSSSYATSATTSTLEQTYSAIPLPTSLLQPGENLLAVEVHQAAPDDDDLTFDLELTGTLRSTTTVAINVSASDPTTDTDKDGLPDLLEYALGTDASTVTPRSEATPELAFSANTIDVTYTRAQTNLIYILQTSSNLKTWQDVAPTSTIISQHPDNTETITATIPASGEGNFFLRIQVNTP